jgi:hypothetical protein
LVHYRTAPRSLLLALVPWTTTGYGLSMPTVLRSGAYRLFFYSADGIEPPHVHVERDDKTAKFWLRPIRLQQSGGFNRVEIARLRGIVEENLEALLRSWDEYFVN